MKKRPLSYIHNPVDADATAELKGIARHKRVREKLPKLLDQLEQSAELPRNERIEKAILPAWQALRDSAVVPESECFGPIAACIGRLTAKRILISPELNALQERIREFEAPDEAQRLEQQWEEQADKITAATFREYGEEEMADLYENDRAEFKRRREQSLKKL